jgi:teichuronic acid biosynthesis glycosyltransferase TuaG
MFISICIPAYNAAKYLGETLDSVKKQTYKNWELVVVEDGSDDGTKDIVENFKNEVNNAVLYIKSERNLGLTYTRNIAANASKGDWIALLDSDDLWTEDHLADLVETANKNPDCEFIHSGSILFNSDTRKEISVRAPSVDDIKNFPLSLFNRTYLVQPSSVMTSRKIFIETGGSNTSFRYSEDIEYWFRIAKQGFKFAFTNKNTCLYRKHSSALTANVLEITREVAKVYDDNQNWDAIPLKIRKENAAESWLATARISRGKNRKLSIECIRKSLSYKFSPRQLFYFVAIKFIP